MSSPRAIPSAGGAAGDDTTRVALTLLTLLIAAVVASVLGFAVLHTRGGSVDDASSGPVTGEADSGFPAARLDFSGDSDTLPSDALGALAAITETARSDSARTVHIQAYRGPDVTSAQQAAQRAERVRHALEADGVSRDQLLIDPPLLGSASRVDVRVD